MAKFKTIIVILAIVLIITIIVLVCILARQEIKDQEILPNQGDNYVIETNKEMKITNMSNLTMIEDCIKDYYSIANYKSSIYFGRDENGENKKIVEDSEIEKNVFEILSEKFKTENKLSIDNVKEYIRSSEDQLNVTALQAKMVYGDNTEKYAVYGILTNIDYKLIDEFYIYVNLDIKNETFSIEPINEKPKNFEKLKIENEDKQIKETDYNTYESTVMENEELTEEYLTRQKILTLAVPEKAYDHLDKEYREKRFGNYENYLKYIEKNREMIEQSALSKYKVDEKDDVNTQYVCLDQYGKYYIFKESYPPEYTVMLDTYTINIPEFIEKYDNASDENKVKLNVQKVLEAINNKDYKYVYDKLDETFRNNNFESEEQFEQYMSEKIGNRTQKSNIINEKNGDLYIYGIELYDKNDEEAEKIKIEIVMQLKEKYDYVISFNIQ